MATFTEGNLAVSFPDDWDVSKFDNWDYYQDNFKNYFGGNKAIDFVAFDPGTTTLWLIELKDYRHGLRVKSIELCEEVAIKIRDSLACLVAAGQNNTHAQFGLAHRAVRAGRMRVVLHAEGQIDDADRPQRDNKLRDYRSKLRQKLKQLVKPIDASPMIVELKIQDSVPWTARHFNATQ